MGVKGAQAVGYVRRRRFGLNPDRRRIRPDWSAAEGSGIPRVAVKCVEMWRNTGGEGGFLGRN